MVAEVSEFMGAVKADVANIKFMLEKLDRKIENQNGKMDDTVKAMQNIVSNCRSESRQENMGRDENIVDVHKRIDAVVKETNLNFGELHSDIAGIRGDLKWYGGALAVVSAVISFIVAFAKEYIPPLRGL